MEIKHGGGFRPASLIGPEPFPGWQQSLNVCFDIYIMKRFCWICLVSDVCCDVLQVRFLCQNSWKAPRRMNGSWTSWNWTSTPPAGSSTTVKNCPDGFRSMTVFYFFWSGLFSCPCEQEAELGALGRQWFLWFLWFQLLVWRSESMKETQSLQGQTHGMDMFFHSINVSLASFVLLLCKYIFDKTEQLHKATWSYMKLHEATGSYTKLHDATRSYMILHGATWSYMMLHDAT